LLQTNNHPEAVIYRQALSRVHERLAAVRP
jgi:hypothetical protein